MGFTRFVPRAGRYYPNVELPARRHVWCISRKSDLAITEVRVAFKVSPSSLFLSRITEVLLDRRRILNDTSGLSRCFSRCIRR